MAVKAGQILHDAYGFVVDRIQTGGATGLNIPEEKVYEVGNFQAVATVRDTPDLSFDLETLDVSTEIEALLTFTDPTLTMAGDAFDLSTMVPMDIISPIKDGWNIFTASRGVVIPYLTLESSTYRFEMKGNASQRHTLRGDSYFFVDGSPYYEEYEGDGSLTAFSFSNGPAQPYSYLGHTYYALGVTVVYPDRTYKRCFLDEDYTNTATGITLTAAAPAGSTVKVVYGSTKIATYSQDGNTPAPHNHKVHEDVTIKPAAIRGKNVDVFIGDNAATPTFTRWSSVQSAEVNWRVTLDKDEEFGNAQAVSQDHDVPEVSGSIVVRPRDVAEMWDKVYDIVNVPRDNVAGPLTSIGLPMEIRVSDPDTGARLKTLYVPDARFKPPAISGRVQTKLEPTFEWTSDGGTLLIYKGAR